MKKIYFILENRIHNINDKEYQLLNDNQAYIGKYCGSDGFRVDHEVTLYTLAEAEYLLNNN